MKPMPGRDDSETILRPGQIVAARYRVGRLIAKGGMAAVWAGVDEHTGKHVALKVILHSFAADSGVVKLFRREALSASKVNHPNVVNIFDVIDHEGMPCIVMEVLEGETLATYLARNGALSLEKTLALLLPTMRGVAAANAQGIVHRDLKPANVFLCGSADGHLLTTKVLDFGISVVMRRIGETAPVTERLAMFGTPAYMAPEAIQFSPSIDGRADVYGFGVLFFEALTGTLPFLGPPGMALLENILTEPPPSVALYRPDLPLAVVQFVARALEKDPNNRFVDMAHLIRATEKNLLPLLPTPHSMVPISGILLLPPAKPSASVPVAERVLDGASLGPGKYRETRALYSPPDEPWRAVDHPARAQRGRQRFARTSIGVTIIVVVIGMTWEVIPSPSSDHGVEAGQSLDRHEIAASVRKPAVGWPPESYTLPSSPPMAARAVPAASNATAPMLRVTASRPSRRLLRERSMVRRSQKATPSRRSSAPTAGRLNLSEF
jgi:serine/threonine-protein kinase